MNETERQIVELLINDLINAGHTIDVYDGEVTTLRYSNNVEHIIAALASTDQDHLVVRKEGHYEGFVLLVWGNDEDVICDYSVSLENVLYNANQLAETGARNG